MPKAAKTTTRSAAPLYRLIAAGQLVHRAVLAPLLTQGLEPGDDAVLYVLASEDDVTAAALAETTGLTTEALRRRLARLIERGLVVLRAGEAGAVPTLALTDRGARLEELIADHWSVTETALLGELTPRQRKVLGKRLTRIIALLTA
ncbi:MAG: MarR family transcriptional regulator [Devosia sp.]